MLLPNMGPNAVGPEQWFCSLSSPSLSRAVDLVSRLLLTMPPSGSIRRFPKAWLSTLITSQDAGAVNIKVATLCVLSGGNNGLHNKSPRRRLRYRARRYERSVGHGTLPSSRVLCLITSEVSTAKLGCTAIASKTRCALDLTPRARGYVQRGLIILICYN